MKPIKDGDLPLYQKTPPKPGENLVLVEVADKSRGRLHFELFQDVFCTCVCADLLHRD